MGVVRLRLQRLGRRHRPFYRIVAADSRSKRDGKHLEILGTYDPIPRDGVKDVRLKVDRVQYWLSVGAQPADTVGRLLGMSGIIPSYPRRMKNQESVPKSERGFCTFAREQQRSFSSPMLRTQCTASLPHQSVLPLSSLPGEPTSTFSFVLSTCERFFQIQSLQKPCQAKTALARPSGTTPLSL